MIKIIEEKSTASENDAWSISRIIEEASKYNSVLDLGCGDGHVIKRIKANSRIGLDACERVIAKAKSRPTSVLFSVCDLNNIELISIREIECIIGVDIIEHFHKAKALQLLAWCEKVATAEIILFVPVGNHPQTIDDRGYGNHYYQTHRSRWYPEEMEELGYDVWFFPTWHKKMQPPKEKGAMFCRKKLKRRA